MSVAWFAVRCVFRFDPEAADGPSTYEERVTIWQAASFEAAIEMAEDEAAKYADDLSCEYAQLAQAFELAEEPGHGAEVFSLMRDSRLQAPEYVDRFFETGDERQGHVASS